MEIKEFLEEYHSEVLKEYERYITRDDHPKVGDTVRTLRSGFGGGIGMIREVVEITENNIILASGEYKFSSEKENWWKELEII